jgi:antitoxin FitA
LPENFYGCILVPKWNLPAVKKIDDKPKETPMATITIKNIPDRIYQKLKAQAKLRHRSLNSEIIYNLEKSVGMGSENPQTLREHLAEFRERIATRGTLSADQILKAIDEGRP